MSELIEKFVNNELSARGFNVKKIKETNVQTPDFYVEKNNEKYLIEVKDKQNSKNFFKQFEDNKLIESSIAFNDTSTIETIIRKSKKQLNQDKEEDNIFKILWFNCSNFDSSATEEQIKTSLYGTQILWDNKENGIVAPCYFFNHSRFFTYRNSLDAVVITTIKNNSFQLIICINTFSKQYSNIKNSELVSTFNDAYLDPYEDECNKKAFIVDNNISRESQDSIILGLNQKYNANFIPFKMYSNSVSILHK